mgnify:CR=1 FL=1
MREKRYSSRTTTRGRSSKALKFSLAVTANGPATRANTHHSFYYCNPDFRNTIFERRSSFDMNRPQTFYSPRPAVSDMIIWKAHPSYSKVGYQRMNFLPSITDQYFLLVTLIYKHKTNYIPFMNT